MAMGLLGASMTAAAEEPEQTAGAELRLAGEIQERFGLIVEEPQRWSPADLESVLRGAQALPRAAWEFVDGPVTLEYVEQRCLFSMGRYGETCPTFAEGYGRFFIYDEAPLRGEGPVDRLAVLDAEEQRDIQVRRAIVHLVMVHLDREFGWSSGRAWSSINGWSSSANRPLNEDPWGYSRYLGMRSAHLDLVTFGEEYFVRPEDLLIEGADDPAIARRLEALDPNATVACQQFTHRRILSELLTEVDEEWAEPARVLPHEEAGQPRCPAFHLWARPDLVAGFDILLAAATANQPESLFGHLLLHVRYDTDGRVRGQGFEPVYQFGAVTETDVDIFRYVTRGVLGGFPSVFELHTFRGIDRMFLQYQQRNLERYTLQLTEDQKQHFLQRIWEAERRIRYPYAFFSKNCASFLTDLLAPVVEVPEPGRGINIVMPTDVLDGLARMENEDEGPLLVKRPDTLRSNRDVAEDAVLQRRALIGKFMEAVEDDPELDESFRALIEELDTLQPGQRHEAYLRAAGFFDRFIEKRPELSQEAVDFLYHSVLVERYFMEMAHFARRAVYAQVKGGDRQFSVDELLERRRELYRIEDLEARIQALNAMNADDETDVEGGEPREFTEQELSILDFEERTRKTYLTALEVQAGLIDRHVPDWSGVAYLDERARQYYEEKRRIDELSEGPSGRNRIHVGASWDGEKNVPVVEVSYSMMEEFLGEVRRRGYGGDLGTRILGVDAQIPVDRQALDNMRFDLVLFTYDSLEKTHGPLRRGIFDSMGWGLDVRIVHDGRRGLWAAGELDTALYLPIFSGSEEVHHLVAHLGPAIRYDVHRDQNPLLGATAGLFGQVHLYGRFSNVLRFGVKTSHFAGLGPQWRFDLTGRAESRHVVARLRGQPLMLAPFVEGLWSTRDYRDDGPEEGFQSWRGGMRIEVPF